MFKFIILIPSFNEYNSLKKIAKKLSPKNKILIMDDCSNDKTRLLKNRYKNIKIISNKTRLGYEKNLKKGIKILSKSNYSHIITFDADGEHHTSNIEKIKTYIKNNKSVDLLIGNRSTLNRFSEKILSFLFFLRFKVIDPLSGLKAYKVSELKKNIKNIKLSFFLADLIVLYYKNNKIIKNIKIKSVKIKNRKSKVGSFIKSNLKILNCLKFLI